MDLTAAPARALTGLAMTQIMASGQCWAQAAARVATMVALVLNRSSRVIPGRDSNLRTAPRKLGLG